MARLKRSMTLRALMVQEGHSLGTLAAASGCSKGFVSHLLAERRFSCTAQLAGRIAEALSVPIDVLFAPEDAIADCGTRNHARPAA